MLAACQEAQTLEFSTGEVQLSAEGPLFEGSNTVTGEYASQLESFLGAKGFQLSQLREARLSAASIALPAGDSSARVSQMTFSLVADAVEMQELGVLNPVPEGSGPFALNLAQEQKGVADFLRQPRMTFILDATLPQDRDSSLALTGNFTFSLTLNP
jgi:hypothetical protein